VADPGVDPESGLQYLRARYYDPTSGQFLTRDPLEQLTRQPYADSVNDPINASDPSGLAGCGDIPLISSVCNWLQQSGVSDVAAGALNGLTGGLSNQVAGGVFGFNPDCANYGTAGNIAQLAAFGFGLFDGETELGVAAEDAGAAAGDVGASAPVGRSGSPIEIEPGTNEPGEINGRPYSGHAFDRMQGRGIPPSAVEDAINNPASTAAGRGGTTIYRGSDGVTVVAAAVAS
jgi:RHS repeat-associated protein